MTTTDRYIAALTEQFKKGKDMSSYFIVRVELHNADPELYDILHENMKNWNFKKRIKFNNNKVYDLPNAEYFFIDQDDKHKASAVKKTVIDVVETSIAEYKLKRDLEVFEMDIPLDIDQNYEEVTYNIVATKFVEIAVH